MADFPAFSSWHGLCCYISSKIIEKEKRRKAYGLSICVAQYKE